jgi:branched-chain amino acid transport system ATP-binding protein
VRGLSAGYGSAEVLHDVSLDAEEGETDVLLGRAGSGKSTTLLSIAGCRRPWGGEVRLAGEAVTGMDTWALIRRGLVLVPQGRHLFPDLTVEENLRLGAWAIRRDRAAAARGRELALDVVPDLSGLKGRRAGALSAFEQQLVALGRGLMASPRLLLVDEPSTGLGPKPARDLFRLTRRLNAEGLTVLMAEQNAGILRHADWALIMDRGRVRFSGVGADLAGRDEVREAFFGAPIPS